MEENKHITLNRKVAAYYRPFEHEPNMVVVFELSSGLQIGNYDRETFEKNLKNGIFYEVSGIEVTKKETPSE